MLLYATVRRFLKGCTLKNIVRYLSGWLVVVLTLVVLDDAVISPASFSLTLLFTENGFSIAIPQAILWTVSFVFGLLVTRSYFMYSTKPEADWGLFTKFAMRMIDRLMTPRRKALQEKEDSILRNALTYGGFILSTLLVGSILTTIAVSRRRGSDWNWRPWAVFGSGLYALEFALLHSWAATGAFNLWEAITRLF